MVLNFPNFATFFVMLYNGVREASSSNLDTRTQKVPLSYESGTFSILLRFKSLPAFEPFVDSASASFISDAFLKMVLCSMLSPSFLLRSH